MITVVTGWSPKGYEKYGRTFVESFDRHWPKDIQLIVYGEEPVELPRGEFRALSQIPGCVEFLQRNDNPLMRGRHPNLVWKDKERENGYSFRFDAWKFCRQGFIPYHAAQGLTGLMCWLDADVVTFADVPEGFIESLLPDGKDLAYLGRHPKFSEIGFQLYRLPQALPMLGRFAALYATDEVFSLPEWHSAYVFDRAREQTSIAAHDMTPGGSGHVWFQSPLREYMDHLKGNRKARGRSKERDKCSRSISDTTGENKRRSGSPIRR